MGSSSLRHDKKTGHVPPNSICGRVAASSAAFRNSPLAIYRDGAEAPLAPFLRSRAPRSTAAWWAALRAGAAIGRARGFSSCIGRRARVWRAPSSARPASGCGATAVRHPAAVDLHPRTEAPAHRPPRWRVGWAPSRPGRITIRPGRWAAPHGPTGRLVPNQSPPVGGEGSGTGKWRKTAVFSFPLPLGNGNGLAAGKPWFSAVFRSRPFPRHRPERGNGNHAELLMYGIGVIRCPLRDGWRRRGNRMPARWVARLPAPRMAHQAIAGCSRAMPP